jgi:hypothetical protein
MISFLLHFIMDFCLFVFFFLFVWFFLLVLLSLNTFFIHLNVVYVPNFIFLGIFLLIFCDW